MTAQSIAVLGGVSAGIGLTIVLRELLPARVDLRDALARLQPEATSYRSVQPVGPARTALSRQAGAQLDALARRLPMPREDLRLLDQPAERFAASKLLMAGYGLALPGVVSFALALIGLSLPVVVPAVACLAFGALFFLTPDLVVRSRAREKRAAFRRAVGAYLDLVALERFADAGPAEALERAASIGEGWAFARIADALHRARLAGATPWQALTTLAGEVGIDELRDLADIISLAGDDGAAIAQTLTAKAATLRAEELAAAETAANTASERLTLPGVLLAFGFLILVCYPALARVLTT